MTGGAAASAHIFADPPWQPKLETALMAFFDVRRARVKREYARLYPEIVPGVWISARHAARLVQRNGPRTQCLEEGCSQGRVLCELHFEFRGGRTGRQYLTGEWTPRADAARAS